jgi:niacin transporter
VVLLRTRDLTRASVLLALGIILPSFFHLLGIPGQVFLPMHIPVFLGGFLLGSGESFLLGVVLPPVNFLVSGMPPFPNFFVMMGELGVYGLASSLFFRRLRWGIVPSLFGAMLLGRAVAISGYFVLFAILGRDFNVLSLLQSLFVVSLPGIAIQLVAVPGLAALILRREKDVAGYPRLL